MKIKDSFNVRCPYGIMRDKNITAADFRVWCYMKLRFQFFQMQGSDFYESITTISESVNLGERAVKSSIKNLQENGYLEVVERPGKSNLYITFDKYIN